MKRAAFLALPLLGLAALWGWTDHRTQQGTEWEVPVQGYDPRDLLSGHYITYRYEWPGLAENQGGALCIEGTPPLVRKARAARDGEACANFVAGVAPEMFGQPQGTLGGKLFVPQDKAAGLERQLGDAKLQGLIRLRLRADGHVTPLSIRFRPR